MKKNNLYLFLLLIVAVSCTKVPITGRNQMLLVTDQEVLSLSNQSFAEYMKTASPSTNKANQMLVEKVGKKIAFAVEKYLKDNGLESQIATFKWEFHLVKDSTANAFCMPGGKIVVNEGILPYTKNEAGLAVVLGHEVAHAVAKHSNERMTEQMITQYGSSILDATLKTSAEKKQLAQTVYGLGAQYGVMLPFSRKHEYEADKMGLIFMAMAKYNVNEAVVFWERMSSNSGKKKPMELFSTHPDDANRISRLKEAIPEAMKYIPGN